MCIDALPVHLEAALQAPVEVSPAEAEAAEAVAASPEVATASDSA